MKVLVTGFDPFGGEYINPAYEAVKLLPSKIGEAEIIKLEIPTAFRRSVQVLEKAMDQYKPDIILNVGQAGGRSCVTVERVALNLAEARIPDNDGEQPQGESICPDGESAYYATIPVMAAVEAVRKAGLPCHMSYSAGTYVCNAVMYQVLHVCSKKYPDVRAGFVHVPYSTKQVVNKPNGTPSMSLTDISTSLEHIIEACVCYKNDIVGVSGEIH